MNQRLLRVLFTAITTILVLPGLFSQEKNLDDIKSEIMAMTDVEINAMKSGDCQTLINLLTDDVTFYLNGRKAPSKEMIFGFCTNVPRPFEQPSNITTDYLPLSQNSAYVVRTMEFSKEEKVYKKEIVTKIWIKVEDGWKIAHLHSTIKEF